MVIFGNSIKAISARNIPSREGRKNRFCFQLFEGQDPLVYAGFQALPLFIRSMNFDTVEDTFVES